MALDPVHQFPPPAPQAPAANPPQPLVRPAAHNAPPPPRPAAEPHSGATIDEEGGAPPVHLTFWQQPWVQDVLPFLTSLALHAGIILVVWMTATAVVKVVQVVKEQIIIPDATIVEGAEIGGIPHPGLGGDPTRDAAQDKIMDVPPDSQGWSEKPSINLTNTLMGGGGGDTPTDPTIGIGLGGSFGKGKGIGSGVGSGVGSGAGDGSGALAPFGVPGGGGGIGPKAPFMGMSGNARFVAYVCDASGSMMNRFDSLRVELRKAIDNLRVIQSFNVIFFQETSAAAVDKNLVVANPENKRKAYDFLEKTAPHGSTDPIPALKIAFDSKPQLIYLLTDGDFPDNEAVLKYIRERDKDHSVKINTIAFVTRGEEYEKVLKTIATETGGLFKYVSDKELEQ